MKKRVANKIKNEETIINAAIELFIHKGVRNTSIQDIVENTGLARGTFYNYFKSKDELWQKVVAQSLKPLNEARKLARQAATTPRAFIYDSYLAVLTILNTPPTPALYAENQVSIRYTIQKNPGIFSIYVDLEKDLRESPFFQHLPEHYYKMTAHAMGGVAAELVIRSYLHGDNFTAEEMAEYLTTLFEKGILNI